MVVTNWVTTYGEVIVRVPQRALTWKNANAGEAMPLMW